MVIPAFPQRPAAQEEQLIAHEPEYFPAGHEAKAEFERQVDELYLPAAPQSQLDLPALDQRPPGQQVQTVDLWELVDM